MRLRASYMNKNPQCEKRKEVTKMKKSIRRFISIALALIMLLALCACGGSKDENNTQDTSNTANTSDNSTNTPPEETVSDTTDDGEPVYGGSFAVGKAMSCMGLCDLYKYNVADQYNFPAVESLGRWNFETQEYDCHLLESWEHDYENNTFTMHMRQGVNFHDGTVCDAEAIKWNLEFYMEHRGSAALGNPTSLEVTDEYTLVAHFDEPSFAWEGQYAVMRIYSPTAYSEHDEDWAQTHVVGTGPFVFESYTPDEVIVYTRNDNYWQEGKPYLDTYYVRIITDWAALEAAFISGDNNYYNVAEASTCKEMQAMGYTSVAKDVPENYMQFMVVVNNTVEDDPFYNKDVRDAILNYAIDWTGITMSRDDGRGLCTMQSQLCTQGGWGYIEDFWMDEDLYDQDKAKDMLADAGYPNGFKTNIWTSTTYQTMATQIQSELKKIGVEAEVQLVETSSYMYDQSLTGIHMGAWVNSTDCATHLTETYYPGQYAIIDYSDEYVAAVDAAAKALTKEERAAAQQEAFRILYEDMCVTRAYFRQWNFTVVAEGAHNVGAEYKTYYTENIWWDNK